MGKFGIIVAPYSPGVHQEHLGAARKIEVITGILAKLGYTIIFVDSSHAGLRTSGALDGVPALVGQTDVCLWRPPTLGNRKLGKLLQLALANRFAAALIKKISPQDVGFVWIYNAYAFESRFALHLQRMHGLKVVLELEDLPRSRGRGLNPKPYIDSFYFPRVLAASGLSTFVNQTLLERYASVTRRALLLPSVLHQDLIRSQISAKFAARQHRVGYFGGLTTEKGAGILLKALAQLPETAKLVVTGHGDLSRPFAEAALAHSGKLEFHGRVNDSKLLELMLGCDIIVNPHASILAMKDGIFPFKVCEALATGALVISTALPRIEVDLNASVLFFDGTAESLCEAIAAAKDFYVKNRDHISATSMEIRNEYGEGKLLLRLKSIFHEMDVKRGQT